LLPNARGLAELRLSAEADADLTGIWRWTVERYGAGAADEYLLAFDEVFDLLRRHPEAGAVREDVRPPVRSFVCRSHRVFYDLDAAGVLVVRVLHGRMSAERRG